MSEVTVHPVPAEWKKRAYIDNKKYLETKRDKMGHKL